MKIYFTNLDTESNRDRLSDYLSHLENVRNNYDFSADEASLLAPFDKETISETKSLSKDLNNKNLKYIFVVGIGGSSLGAKTLYSGLKNKDTKRIIWLESVENRNMDVINNISEKIENKEEIAIIIISKSGKTTESIANASILLNHFENKFNEISDRVAVISNNDTPLCLFAEDYHAHILNIRKRIGGRFSVFSPAGLLPLYLSGVDVDGVILGAQKAVEDLKVNDSISLSSLAIYNDYKKGINIHNHFIFDSSLENFGKWYRQLFAESLGKERDINNREVRIDITPTVSIGSNDLHSVGQLYLAGKKNEITTFISVDNGTDITIPKHPILKPIEYIEGKSINNINKAILEGTKQSYKDSNLSFVDIKLDNDKRFDLGYLMQSMMLQVMVLGHLFEINTFNQPAVEKYKKITREILEK